MRPDLERLPDNDIEIACHAVLDVDGRPSGDLPAFASDRETVVSLYRAIMLTRTFDEKAVSLQRTGRLGTFASSLGQEAVSVGAASAMRTDDVFLPSFREQGGQLWRGVSMVELFQFWGGDERGSDFAGPRGDFSISIPVASHIPHACGVALALKLGGDDRAALTVFGDGATSKGDFYEAVNLAGVWDLPVVFVIANNQWAISVPRDRQTASRTLAQKAVAAGIAGIQVDGNDVFAVRQVVSEALDLARRKRKPTLIEALTYRMSDHTTADDARRYRADEEVSPHWHQDPLTRLRNFLTTTLDWSRDEEEALIEDCRAVVDTAAEAYLALPSPRPVEMFDSLYAVLPEAFVAQRDDVARYGTIE